VERCLACEADFQLAVEGVLSAEAVAKVVAEQSVTIKNSLLYLPDKLCKAVAGQTDPDAVRDLLLAEVEFAISALRNEFAEEVERSNEEIARLEKTQTKQLEINNYE
jgi:hypothetical protein